MLQYAVIEFDDASVETLPTIWLDEVDGELVALWPDHMSETRRATAIENCEPYDEDFTLYERVRVMHSYNSLLVARANSRTAEETSSLEPETEELGRGSRSRKRRTVNRISDDEDDEEVQSKRSKHPSAPTVNKSISQKIKEKLNQGGKNSSSSSTSKPSRTIRKSPLQSSNSNKKSPLTTPECLKESPLRQSSLSPAGILASQDQPFSVDLSEDKENHTPVNVVSGAPVRRALDYGAPSMPKDSIKKMGHKKVDMKKISEGINIVH
ncbi:hypothetical protein FOCC_FOCC011582 [Frankliniella occidentalis]|nr:hypothetical protein FOCC_FOCC011582 [Frankliniella occidentalis]